MTATSLESLSDKAAPAGLVQPASRHGYLPFVDGLRAVSILAVLAAHARVPLLAGGYVGVDVFFVISGFLILGHTRRELRAGTFSLFAFFARRVLRIFPALATAIMW
jgi:peptidoglycan/LPS O-acetylase OafA/YrhL